MSLTELDRHNLTELERLNQRGGRMLSLVDLIEANTVSLELGAELVATVSRGCSLLTGAVPGGSGKTTVMAALLNFLPPGLRLVTVADGSLLRQRFTEPVCFLPHEIGSGPWFGYVWGSEVPALFAKLREGHYLASCIHCDTLAQLAATLCSAPLDVAPEDFRLLDLALFLRVRQGPAGLSRRVSQVYQKQVAHGEHTLRWEWLEAEDAFRCATPLEQSAASGVSSDQARSLLQHCVEHRRRELADVRQAYLELVS